VKFDVFDDYEANHCKVYGHVCGHLCKSGWTVVGSDGIKESY